MIKKPLEFYFGRNKSVIIEYFNKNQTVSKVVIREILLLLHKTSYRNKHGKGRLKMENRRQ